MVTIQKKKYFNKRRDYWFSWPNDVVEHLDSDVKGGTLILECVGGEGHCLLLQVCLFPPLLLSQK